MTEITIELTDLEVEWLRLSEAHGSMHDRILRKVKAALPLEPIKLEIELPAEHASPLPYWHNYDSGGPYMLAPHEAAVLNAVRAALQSRADR